MMTRSNAPLPVPHKDLVAVRLARIAARAVKDLPRTPSQLRSRLDSSFDRRFVATSTGREQLIRGWGRIARTASKVPGTAPILSSTTTQLGLRLQSHGHSRSARDLLDALGETLPESSVPVPLRARARILDLNLGRDSDNADSTADLTAQSLLLADGALARGDHDEAASHLQTAFDLALHRVHHFEDTPSPYALDPDAFLAPFRQSKAFQAGVTPTGRIRPATRRRDDEGRPHRILFATTNNFNFARDTIREYADRDDVDVREVDIRRLEKGPWRPDPGQLTRNRLRHAAGLPMEVPAHVREDFDWADTVFVEWGHRAMAWVSMLPDVRARIVVRLHSYEALTQFPFITDWSGIDDLVFVSGHIRALVEHAIPEVLSGPRIHTIGNRNVLDAYDQPKRHGAARTLGLIGWGQVVKDAQWAIDVLEELRRDDPSWKLRLIGHGFADDAELTRPAAAYKARLEERIEALGDAVIRPGHTKDLPHALRRIGVILSSSLREGTHESLIQGAASGALPIVRNWPVVARWGGAHTMFPDSWVVETPPEAADRIRAAAATGDLLAEGAKAREWVSAHYDWSVIGPQLEELLLDRTEELRA